MSPVSPWQWIEEQHRQGRELCLILDSLGEMETRQTLLNGRACDRYASVYDQTSVARLANAGPYLILLSRADTEALSGLLGAPERNWGWLASIAQGDLPALLEHWRQRFLLGSRPNQALYRFHDNRVLARALAFMPQEARPGYLGPAVSVCYWHETHWEVVSNPAPGKRPVPDEPAWLNVPALPLQAIEILHANVYRYLWAEHSDEMLALSQLQDPDEWLTEQLAQVRHWAWTTPEQVHFLVLQRLTTWERPVIKNWSPRAEETPAMHFERLFNEVQFWSEERTA